MKKLVLFALLTAFVLNVSAQTYPPKNTPQLEFALQLRVTLGESFITGGEFEGPNIKGTIINGGADYQLTGADGRSEVEAIYCIKTDDGVYIHVRNRGIIAGGNGGFYFKCAPQFEAPADSKYGWMNNALFVCEPEFSQSFKGIVLNVWKVK